MRARRSVVLVRKGAANLFHSARSQTATLPPAVTPCLAVAPLAVTPLAVTPVAVTPVAVTLSGLLLMAATLWCSPAVLAAAEPAPAATPAAIKPDPTKAAKIAEGLCAACHGPDGNSTAPANPKLAGQHPPYLRKQLLDFKVADGQKVGNRASAVMAGFAATLSEADVANLAAFYSGQALKPSAARNKETVALGQAIYRYGVGSKGVPACSACHGPNGAGMPNEYPMLGGQYAEYTEAQLTAFRSGARANNQPMREIAERLSDLEIKAVADYIAGLR